MQKALVCLGALTCLLAQGLVQTTAQEAASDKALTILVLAAAPKPDAAAPEYRCFMHGSAEPVTEIDIYKALAAFAKENDGAAFPGMNKASGQSDNWLAIRADARSPALNTLEMIALSVEHKLHRLALADSRDFPDADYELSRESPAHPWRMKVHTEIGAAYRRIEVASPSAGAASRPLDLWLDYEPEARNGQMLVADYHKPKGSVSVEHAHAVLGRDVDAPGARLRKAQVEALSEYLAGALKAETNCLRLCLPLGSKGTKTMPWGFFLMVLDALQTVNGGRAKAGKDALPLTLVSMSVPEPETAAIAKAYAHRRARGGGGRPHDNRVKAALDWLADHQNADGHWSGANFSGDSTRKNARKTHNLEFVSPGDAKGDKGWEQSGDIGLTGLAVMAFTAGGHSHNDGDYKETIRRALLFLLKVQTKGGCFGPKDEDLFVYNHAMATIALAEAYGLSGDEALKPALEAAVKFILLAQNPGMGWRYGVKTGHNDSSVTAWMIQALFAAKLAGIEIDTLDAYSGAAKWFEAATILVRGYPKTGYNMPGSDNARLRSNSDYETNPTMDAVHILAQLMMNTEGFDINNRTLMAQARNMADKAFLPSWEKLKVDYYYWYFASHALYQMGGSNWATWEKAMSKTLLDNQRGWRPEDRGSTKDTLDEHGSWDAVDAWGIAGGRVFSTAMNCLTLQSYHRFLKPRVGKSMATAHEP